MPVARSETLSIHQPESIEIPSDTRLALSFHQHFTNFHHDLYRDIASTLTTDTNGHQLSGRHFPVGYTNTHSDGSDFYAALERKEHPRPKCVIAPVWFAPPMHQTLFYISEMANAFTKSLGENGQPLTQRFQALFPYAELRQDRNTSPDQKGYWGDIAYETVMAQLLADTIIANGVTEAIFLDPHSADAVSYFDSIDTLCLTAAPLFADWLIENGFVDKNSVIAALDLGTLQRNVHLAQVISRKVGYQLPIALFDKTRPEASKIEEHVLIRGDVNHKRAIVFDDIGATMKSILSVIKLAKDHGCRQIVPCITHGVLCGEFLKNINLATSSGSVPAMAYTDSLPQAQNLEFMPVDISVLSVGKMLAYFSKISALTSIDDVKNDPQYQDYILTPKHPSQVLEELDNNLDH